MTSSHNINVSCHVDIDVKCDNYVYIEASEPVLVLHYFLLDSSETTHNHKDVFMLNVPALEQRNDQYIFLTDREGEKSNGNVIITTTSTDGLLLDGHLVNLSSNWISIEGTQANYSAIQLAVNKGLHNITHVSSNALFMVMSYTCPYDLQQLHLTSDTQPMPPYKTQTTKPDEDSKKKDKNIVNDVIPKTAAHASVKHNYVDAAVRSKTNSDDEFMSPTVIAVIVSLSAALLAVVLFISGFLVAEFGCRRHDSFRNSKVTPYSNQSP